MNRRYIAPLLLLTCSSILLAQASSRRDRGAPVFVERVTMDWDHSGKPTTFTLSFQHRTDGAGDADRLLINQDGKKPWVLLNHDDEWNTLKTEIPKYLLRKNLIRSERMLFIASSQEAGAHIYLVLKGGGFGCCVGSLTVLTPGDDGTPKVVFHAVEHLLDDVFPLDGGDGIVLTGQPSDDEARALKNAASYDPYRVYVIHGNQPSHYDLERSKAYTIKHYCEWAGPKYSEKFVAVNVDDGQYGAGHCRTMTEEEFSAYRMKHPAQFPE